MGGTLTYDELLDWQAKQGHEVQESAKKNMSQAMQLLTSHKSCEWYTPEVPYIKLVRQVLGNIDLDPASDLFANSWIKADKIYTKQDNGLLQEWHGNVYMNPPYGKAGKESNMNLWLKKLEYEFRQGRVTNAIALVNSTHGYDWYEDFFARYTCCLVRKRIRFINEKGEQAGESRRGQTFFLFSKSYAVQEAFNRSFSNIGRIISNYSEINRLG